MQTLPWIVDAGQRLAKCHADAESTDKLTRISAECLLGVARQDLKQATETVAFLKKCYAAPAAAGQGL